MKKEIKITAHSKYRCKYHIVFAPKYRRKVIYNKLHMLVSIPPYLSVAQFMGKSALMIFDRHTIFKYNTEKEVFGQEDIL